MTVLLSNDISKAAAFNDSNVEEIVITNPCLYF